MEVIDDFRENFFVWTIEIGLGGEEMEIVSIDNFFEKFGYKRGRDRNY